MLSLIKKNRIWFIVAFGVILYLWQYLANSSLRLDEAMVTLSIIKLPISSFLHQPLPELQVAPFGFLVIEKLLISLFGTGEYILRLFPLICGVASLWLFYQMAKIYLNGKFIFYALVVFTFTPALIYFSSQVKPYSSDVFFTLFSYVVIAPICLKELDWNKTIVMAWLGAIMIWFSFPTLFVLFGIVLVVLFDVCGEKKFPKLFKVGFIFLYWLGSFILFYKVFFSDLANAAETPDFFRGWQNGYITLENWGRIFVNVLEDPIGIPYFLSWLAVILVLMGGYSFFRMDKKKLFLLLIPVALVFLASVFHKYPCKGRLVLFLVPIFLIMIIKGVETLSLRVARYKTAIALLLIGILFCWSLPFALIKFMEPRRKEDIRPVIFYVKGHRLPGDVLFICFATRPAFEYYAPRFGFPDGSYIVQAADYIDYVTPQSQEWKNNLGELAGSNRVWVLISHMMGNKINGKHSEELLLEYLTEFGGVVLDKFSSRGAWVYLFDLSKFPTKE